MFHTALIGWVLHHDADDVNTSQLLHEVARVTAPGGLLLSIAPCAVGWYIPELICALVLLAAVPDQPAELTNDEKEIWIIKLET